MKPHNRELCRQRRERKPDGGLYDFELAKGLDSGADEAAYHAAWRCYLYGPCSRPDPAAGGTAHEDE